ncbi:hypothetical protein J4E86_007962 [Alternaria arbusti]|uniref:uncharacterized protein n=1 Tax=Alternaria arbusti TaxID=232088 RepID=UPI002220C2AE|nr:uncharacterized protein J4E86_007962 [Alternaria arbusti]KAI4948614.1 hypothetical protein J4E86_007962 [Alternaria arbusti]
MHIQPAPVLSRTTLKKYTGWYCTKNGYRAIVTSDGVSLHVGSISHVRGDILETWDLQWSNVPSFRTGGDSAEERALNAEFQATFRTAPGGHHVSFDIKDGKVTGLRAGGEHFERIERGECHIFRVPVELRQTIWGYALDNNGENVLLSKQKGTSITDGHSRMAINRINEVHRDFADEATHFELRYNTLVCTDVGKFVKLIEMDKTRLRLCLRHVVLRTAWGMSPLVFGKTKDIHSILAYAKSNLAATIQVRLDFWTFKGVLAKDMLSFVGFGRGIREAVRGQRSIMCWPGDSGMLGHWQGVPKAHGLNAGNVRFFPSEEVFDEAAFRFQVSLALRKTVTFRHALTPYHMWRPTAIEKLVEDVRGWYENGA